MPQNAAGYELAATRLLNRGRKLSSSGDAEKRAQAELLIAAANTFALLDLASAIRGNSTGSGAAVEDTEDVDDTSGDDDASADDSSDAADEPA